MPLGNDEPDDEGVSREDEQGDRQPTNPLRTKVHQLANQFSDDHIYLVVIEIPDREYHQ